MANITIRNIPDEIFEQIKKLASVEKRSLNNELLLIIEKGTQSALEHVQTNPKYIPKSLQIHLWENLSGLWEDERTTEAIIDDIYSSRTLGREINL
ncbi:MAG: FitA-like ribbon-helix-helix domain-containing protein [Spirochaetia bacterium]